MRSGALIAFIIIPVLIGCSSVETVTKQETHTIVPEAIHEILNTVEKGDTIWAVKEVLKYDTITNTMKPDTIIQIKYFPKLRIVEADIQPDTIFFTETDTVRITHETIQETSFLEKLGYGFIGAILIAVILYFLKRK